LILVDSSGWIEYLAGRPKANEFARYIQGDEPLVTSAIQVYEIHEVVRRDLGGERAIESVSAGDPQGAGSQTKMGMSRLVRLRYSA
jgi:uncharacterized protein with PIN domain